MLATTLAAALFSAVLAGGHDDTVCRPLKELEPKAVGGSLETVPSKLTETEWLARWSPAQGDMLRLKVRTPAPGTYEISIRVAPAADGPVLSARAWEVPLAREGRQRFTLHGPAQDPLLDVRLDPVPMGPGFQVIELECLEPGEILFDCVGLRRTGDETGELGRSRRDPDERPFLGVELGRARPEGVPISRTVPDTAAERAGLAAGDVLVTIDGVPMSRLEEVQDAIAAHRAGDRIGIELLRDGQRITMEAQLGRRPEISAERSARAGHVVEVLQVQPGQVIADIGCGSGWLAEAIAEATGPEGTVYAVEIQERLVLRLHRWSAPNVVPVLSQPGDVSLPEDCLDTAMLHDVASHISRPARPGFYRSLHRALKPDGRLVVFGPHGKAAAMLRELGRFGFIPVDDETLAGLPPEDLDRRLRDGIVFRRP